jgi:hypothetical protein
MANIFQTAAIKSKTPRMSHRFSLQFDGLQNIMALAARRADTYTYNAITGNRYTQLLQAINDETGRSISESLELSLLSVSLPSNEMETVEISRFHDTVKHISKFSSIPDMEVSFYDYISGSASAIMSVWHGMVGDRRTGTISYKKEYILPLARLIEYGPTAPGEGTTPQKLAEHAIVNLYPKSVNLGEHSYESAEVRKVMVTFAIDNVFPLYYNGVDYAMPTAGTGPTTNPLYNSSLTGIGGQTI